MNFVKISIMTRIIAIPIKLSNIIPEIIYVRPEAQNLHDKDFNKTSLEDMTLLCSMVNQILS